MRTPAPVLIVLSSSGRMCTGSYGRRTRVQKTGGSPRCESNPAGRTMSSRLLDDGGDHERAGSTDVDAVPGADVPGPRDQQRLGSGACNVPPVLWGQQAATAQARTAGKFVEFAPGDTIVRRDSPADALYVILGGRAKARGEFEARTLNIGEYFGDVGLLDGGPGVATVVARGELHVMRVPRGSFVRHAQHVPAISFAKLRNLGSRFRRLDAQAARC
jgi:Cyclic nucleotide-binding domain